MKLPQKYVDRILAVFPEKDVDWANAQFERAYNNLECPRQPDDELIERVLEAEFGIPMDGA